MNNSIEKNIVFRKLNENDKELFINLRMAYLMDCYDICETDKKQIENNLKIYFDDHINKNDFIGIIGEYDNKIISVAYLIITEKPPNKNFINGKTGTLMNVYTYPEYRKNGIAKKLIGEIIKEAKTKEINYIDLMATEAGYNLYKKLGFNDSKDKSMNLKI